MGERRPAGAAPIKDHATPLGRSYWRDCALLANDLRGIGRTAVSVGPVGYAWMLIYTAELRVNARFCRRQGSAGSGLLRRCSRPAGTSTVARNSDVIPIMAGRTAVLASGSHDQPSAADGDRRECGRQPEQEPDEARDEGELAEVSSVA